MSAWDGKGCPKCEHDMLHDPHEGCVERNCACPGEWVDYGMANRKPDPRDFAPEMLALLRDAREDLRLWQNEGPCDPNTDTLLARMEALLKLLEG